MKKENKFNLQLHTARLLLEEPFFSSISRVIPKRASESISTAQVSLDHRTGNYEMTYNESWFSSLSSEEVVAVLKHELYHVIFEHLTTRRPPPPPKMDHEAWNKIRNVAQDLAINSHLQNLPLGPSGGAPCKPARWCWSCGEEQADGSITIDENCKNHTFDRFPDKQSMELYLKLLTKLVEEHGEQSIPDDCVIDDHSSQDSVPAEVQKLAQERMKKVIEEAAESCERARSWGSVSEGMQKSIKEMIHKPLDWRKILRYFVRTSQSANKMSTIKRINKRYPYIHSGKKTNRTANIAVSIDQSASVSDEMLGAFFVELNKLASIAEFTVIPFDNKVAEDEIYVWKKGQKRQPARVLSGGTDFDAPTEYVNKAGFDGHIILTDLEAPKPKPSKCQRLWVSTQEFASRPYFYTKERIIAVN
jgi:predicted metal-dependent peptidase